MSTDLRRLLISDILIRFCEQIPYAFVVIWCLKFVKISAVDFGILTSVEMITAILVYVPVAYLVEKKGQKKPFVAITFVFFALFPIFLYYSHSFEILIMAFVLRGLKEFGEPTRKALILQLANEGHKATVYGAYYLIRDLIVTFAALAGGVLWTFSPFVNFVTATFFGICGVVYFLIFCKE